jgi:hypothetical protein
MNDDIGGQAGPSGSGSGSGGGHRLGHGQRRTSLDSGQTGKKPITASRLGLDPVAKQERRREQNRVAQRAFRARAKIREQERVRLSSSHTLPTISLLKSETTQIHPHPLRTRISTNTTQSDDVDDDNQNEDVFDAR